MQRSLGLMALDVAAKRAGLSSSPELTSPVSSGPCSPLEPAAASVLGMAAFPLYNPVLQLKAVADGTSRLMSLHHHQQQQLQQQQHHHHLAALQQQLRQQSKGSPPLSLFPTSNSLSPSSSPLQASGHQPLSPQASRLPGSPGDDAHHSNSKSIKFSIDNILSPAFGGKVEGILMPEKSVKKSSSKRAFDISALTGEAPSAKRPPALPHPEPQKARAPVAKRKNSSDSESSTTSSTFSSASDKKNAKKGRKESSANSHASSPASNCNEPVLNLDGKDGNIVWPAWVYCTRYSDRPSSGKYTLHAALQCVHVARPKHAHSCAWPSSLEVVAARLLARLATATHD